MAYVIGVFGATGKQGFCVVKAVLQKGGFKVRCLVRDTKSSKAINLEKMGCELVQASWEDKNSLVAALRGVRAVSFMTMFASMDKKGCAQESRNGLIAVEAMKEAQVRYVVYSSVASANRNTGIGHFESKAIVEKALRDSGIPCFFLRPAVFFENIDNVEIQTVIKQGKLTFLSKPDTVNLWVSTEDIGAVAAIALADPAKFSGRTLELAGDKISGNQMAQQLGELRGEAWTFERPVPLWLLRVFGQDELANMFQYFDDVGLIDQIDECRQIYPALTTWKQYCKKSGLDKKVFPAPALCSGCQVM